MRDELRGLKENVIVGRLIPAGTGCAYHAERKRPKEEPTDVAAELRAVDEAAAEAAAEAVAEAATDEAAAEPGETPATEENEEVAAGQS